MKKNWTHELLLNTALCLGLGLSPSVFYSQPVASAERLTLALEQLEFYIPIDDLEAFAKDGTIKGDLSLLVGRLSPTQRSQVQQLLQQRLEVSPVLVSRTTYTLLLEMLIRGFGEVIQNGRDDNGFYAIRSSVILAAADEKDGLTLLTVLRKFPNRDVRLNLGKALQLVREFQTLSRYRDAAVSAIAQQAEREATTQATINFSGLPNLQQPGSNSVIRKTLTFTINAERPTPNGIEQSYPLLVDFYLPENPPRPVPLVVYTHGFGANRFNNEFVARHLASHGIAVATPEHIGSNLQYRQLFLSGRFRDVMEPIEFVSRAKDVTFLLDELERLVKTDPAWASQLDLNRVGVMGASYGGTTALAIAGAQVNRDRLQQECQQSRFLFSGSLPLQCYANELPPGNNDLRDPRIKAVHAAYPLTSAVFGAEGMSKITIPTMIMAGSHDIVMSPAIEDQIHPFVWLNTSAKYLALLVPGTHYSSSEDQYIAELPAFMRGPTPAIGRDYLRALSLAFFQAHLNNREDYLPFLNQAYANTISQPDLKLHLIQSLTPTQLEQAYGKKPPLPIVPK